MLNMIPFGIASVFMIVWGMRADKSGERIWNTAIPLALTSASLAATLLTGSLAVTMLLLSLVLVGNYAIKGPFWALSTDFLSARTAAAGIAAIKPCRISAPAVRPACSASSRTPPAASPWRCCRWSPSPPPAPRRYSCSGRNQARAAAMPSPAE